MSEIASGFARSEVRRRHHEGAGHRDQHHDGGDDLVSAAEQSHGPNGVGKDFLRLSPSPRRRKNRIANGKPNRKRLFGRAPFPSGTAQRALHPRCGDLAQRSDDGKGIPDARSMVNMGEGVTLEAGPMPGAADEVN